MIFLRERLVGCADDLRRRIARYLEIVIVRVYCAQPKLPLPCIFEIKYLCQR